MNNIPENYEAARAELEIILKKLEQGNLSLDESMDMFTRGMELCKYCSDKLGSMERRITEIYKNAEGEISEKEFSVNE